MSHRKRWQLDEVLEVSEKIESNSLSIRPRLSISMIHHHGLEMFEECLSSIYSNPPEISFELIVVDNCSTDGAVEMVKSKFPQVRLIEKDRRDGFGHNQNIGINAAQGEYIFVLNDDTLVHKGAIDRLVSFMDQNRNVGLVGPRLLNPDGTLQLSCYKFPSPLRYIIENLLLAAAMPNNPVVGDYRAWAHDSIRDIDFVVGAAMLVRRSVVESVGMFDPIFFMYSEETDWQKRIHDAGWRIVLVPEAQITHIGGQSTEGMRDRQFCEFQKSSIKLIRRHYGFIGTVVQRTAMIAGALLRLSLWCLVFLAMPAKRTKATENLKNWSRLLRWWLGLGPHEGLA